MLGGYWFTSVLGSSPSSGEVAAVARAEVAASLGVSVPPQHERVSLLRGAIPQYCVGHTEFVNSARQLLRERHQPLLLAGNSYDGVGVNDTIVSAKQAAIAVLSSLG